ncbi:hypothetical protein E2C01_019189 [Portunus trituberculatus]|uniref:Uncharacterized protein n=1 Tax=Portunus trituberculatus TaxID=210409 RepID=A0A5B7DY66_PORTR|nr:hypothetical protein [Portunus trituberculatus]
MISDSHHRNCMIRPVCHISHTGKRGLGGKEEKKGNREKNQDNDVLRRRSSDSLLCCAIKSCKELISARRRSTSVWYCRTCARYVGQLGRQHTLPERHQSMQLTSNLR